MTKYLISIAYDGSKYSGLQKLKSELTVQGELESVLSKLDEAPVKVVSSGRTDKGVHALEQMCSFEITKNTTPFRLRYYIDRSTSPYLYVKTCQVIEDENFHARFSVKRKTYKYLINTGEYDPIERDYVYNYNKKLDIESMREAAALFVGPHNYRAFVVGKHETCDSIIDEVEILEEKDIITIRIKGKAFYTYMVRNITSALILVGEHSLKSSDIEKMLTTGEKVVEYSPAPPGGLYLEHIEY